MTTPRVVTVSPAQRAVVGELALDGPSNPVIARRLGISQLMVRNRISELIALTGCDNRTALVCALLRGEIKLRVEL